MKKLIFAPILLAVAPTVASAQDLSIYKTQNPAQVMPKPATSQATSQALQSTLYDLIGPAAGYPATALERRRPDLLFDA